MDTPSEAQDGDLRSCRRDALWAAGCEFYLDWIGPAAITQKAPRDPGEPVRA